MPAGQPVLTLHAAPSGSELDWTALPGVDRYDVVRGDLGALIAQAGQARGRDSLISAAPGACPQG